MKLSAADASAQRRRVLAALAALAALATIAGTATSLSGCGASATLDPVARAAEVSGEQPGIAFSLSMRFSGSESAAPSVAITGSGYVNERERSGQMSMNLGGLAAAGGSQSTAGLGHVQLVFHYPDFYVSFPGLAGKLPEGKTWMKLDLRALAQQRGIQLPQLSSLDQTNPAEFLRYLRASSGGVTRVGSDVVDGVSTTSYRANLRLERILASYPASDRPAVRSALSRLGSAAGIPVDVWIDGQSRVRRITMSLNVASGGLGSGGGQLGAGTGSVGATITIDFTSYGAVPPVVPPPASEVFDATALTRAGLSGGYGE